MAYVTVTLGSVNATNDTNLRAAITGAADGDTILINNSLTGAGTGLKTLTLTDSLQIDTKAIRIVGDGNRDITLVAAAGKPIFDITSSASGSWDRLEIVNLTLTGGAANTSTSAINITYTDPGAGLTRKFDHVRFSNLTISNFNTGISCTLPYTSDQRGNGSLWTVENCEISGCRIYGAWFNNINNLAIRNCEFKTCALHGVYAYACPSISIRDSVVDTCNTDGAAPGSTLTSGAHALLSLCHPFSISNVLIKGMPTGASAARTGIVLNNCNGGFIEGYSCECPSVGGLGEEFFTNSTGIQMTASTRGVKLESMVHKWIRTPVAWDKSCDPPVYENNQIIQSQPSDLSVRGNSYIV